MELTHWHETRKFFTAFEQYLSEDSWEKFKITYCFITLHRNEVAHSIISNSNYNKINMELNSKNEDKLSKINNS